MKYLLVFLLLTTNVSSQVVDGTFPVVSNFKAGAAKVDITPNEVKDLTVTGHTRVVNGVRDPLRAGVLVLDDGETKAAIVTLDVIGAWEDLFTRARAAIEKEIGVPAANIMVCASHNHSGPGWQENPQWASDVINKLAIAAREAEGNMRSVSVGMTEDRIGFGIKRATFYPIRVASEVIELPGKERPVRAELMAMKIGPFLLLTMPGEPKVECTI